MVDSCVTDVPRRSGLGPDIREACLETKTVALRFERGTA